MDLISRQAAIDAIGRDPMGGLNYERILKYLPTAEPKTGRWMFPEPLIHKPICSECGKPCIGLHAFAYELTDYCPNCGAKMEGEDNATD